MLQVALVNFNKTDILSKNCCRNGVIICTVLHEMRLQK